MSGDVYAPEAPDADLKEKRKVHWCCACLNKDLSNRRRCCCCCCWFSVCPCLFILGIGIYAIVSFARAHSSSLYTNIEINGDFSAYYKANEACTPSAPCPLSIMFHEWGGLNQDLIDLADLFVKERKVAVIVPDLYRGTASPADNILYNIILRLSADQTQMDLDSDETLKWAIQQPGVDADRVLAGPGFCFGGTQSLIFSTRQNVSATITLYGSVIKTMATAPDEDWGLLGEGDRVLGIYGREDTRPSTAEVEAFSRALEERNVIKEITIYDSVGHAFVTMHSIKDPSYDGGKAKAAWEQILGYFDALPARRLRAATGVRPTWQTDQWGSLAGVWSNLCAGEYFVRGMELDQA